MLQKDTIVKISSMLVPSITRKDTHNTRESLFCQPETAKNSSWSTENPQETEI